MLITKENYKSLELTKNVSVDTETSGLAWQKDDELFSIVIADERGEYYFDFKDEYFPEQEEFLHEILGDQTRVFFLQNAKFDMHFMHKRGFEIAGKIYDLSFLDRIHFNQHMSYNLDSISSRWGSYKSSSVMDFIKENDLVEEVTCPVTQRQYKKPRFDKVPLSIIQPYAEQDARATLDVGMKILQNLTITDEMVANSTQARPPFQLPVVENESKLVKTLYKMEQIGVKIDKNYCISALNFYKTIINEKITRFKELTGLDFVKGTTVFEEVFLSEKDKWEKTEKGNWKWDANILETFQNPAARIVIEYSEAKKQSEYFENFLFFSGQDSVLHASFKQAGTVTGRLSSHDPNMQNLSNPDKYEEHSDASEYPVRRAFIPREGFFFVMIDYAQVEFRILLDKACAIPLIKEVLLGHDVHTATANLSGASRKEAKTVNFLCIAEEQLVLTNEGLIPIEHVKTHQKVWDGISWVHHDGVIYKGEKECVEYEGLIATEDHEVFTEKGWKVSIRNLSKKPDLGRIMVTEDQGTPIRYTATARGYCKENREAQVEETPARIIQMLFLLKRSVDKFGEYIQRTYANLPLYDMSSERIFTIQSEASKKTAREIYGCGDTMYFPEFKSLSQLWWTRDSCKMLIERVARIFPNKLLGRGNIDFGHRQNEQRGPLRAWQFTSSYEIPELKKQKKKVYDIINAGPNNRFTVSGKLVSNCAYGGGAVKLASNLYSTTGSRAQLGAIYKEMFGWRKSEDEIQASATVTPELVSHNKPLIKKAYDIQQSIFRAAPEIKVFMKNVQQAVNSRGYTFNWFGRRYQFPDLRWAYKAPNHVIQGGSADVLKIAMNEVDNYLAGYKTRQVLNIHDELIFEMAYGEEHLVPGLCEIMMKAYPHKYLPLTVDVEYAYKNLADKNGWPPPHLEHVKETRDPIQGAHPSEASKPS